MFQIALQEQNEELNAKLQIIQSSKTSEHKLLEKMAEIKLENVSELSS